MAANLWTAHITSGNSANISIDEETREVIVTAIAGDCYVVHDSSAHPPHLDTMSTDNTWAGVIVTEGNTLRFRVRDPEDFPWTGGGLYFGPVTPSSGPCTVSVVFARD